MGSDYKDVLFDMYFALNLKFLLLRNPLNKCKM